MQEKFEKWVTDFLASPTEPMNEELSKLFFQCTMGEMDKSPVPEEIKGQFLYKVIDKRAEHIGLLFLTDWTKIFLMFLTKSPGSAIMYLYALRSCSVNCDMDIIANKFPMGFLSNEQMDKMWDAQKGHALAIDGVDNLLDHIEF